MKSFKNVLTYTNPGKVRFFHRKKMHTLKEFLERHNIYLTQALTQTCSNSHYMSKED